MKVELYLHHGLLLLPFSSPHTVSLVHLSRGQSCNDHVVVSASVSLHFSSILLGYYMDCSQIGRPLPQYFYFFPSCHHFCIHMTPSCSCLNFYIQYANANKNSICNVVHNVHINP